MEFLKEIDVFTPISFAKNYARYKRIVHKYVDESDMGRVIGKQGRIAKAIRTVMRAAATRSETRIAVEID